MLCVSLALVAIIGLVFGVLNFHRDLFFIATVEVVVFICCIIILLFVYLRPNYFSLASTIFVVMSFTFGVIASGTQQAHPTIFIWTGLGPLFAFFLLGARMGFMFSAFTVPLCVILFINSHPNLPPVAYLNVIIFILWVVALSLYYEITRADTEAALIRDEEALRKSEERFKQLAEVFPETIFEADIEGHVTYANKHSLEQFGYTDEDLANGLNIFNLVVPGDRDKVLRWIKEKFQGIDRGYLDYQALRKDGSTFYIMGFTVPMMVNGTSVGVRGFILDMTERRQAEEKIKHLATHDALTDLPSLSLAKDRLGMAISLARRNRTAVAVMFIDLDGFKIVNDSFGHEAGDYVLKQVAQRMLSCVRESDTVSRVGGDEFLLIATGIHAPENASQIAEKVVHLLSQPIIFDKEQAVVGTSIGIALYPDDSEDMVQLIKQADEAMYRIKKAGKNGFCFINTALNNFYKEEGKF